MNNSLTIMSIKYRSDIDGLRAIAVLFVVIFHSYDNLIPSGFIGVDIFFVISGFLISSIIRQQLIDNSFSFSDFYRRRLWRLQPALLLVMLFVLVITSILYLPDDYVDAMNSEKYTSLFLSNQYFSRVTTSYAAQDSVYLPLLHTWSLAIEWQWYLFMPPALFLLHRLCHRYHFNKVGVVLLISLLTVALSLYLSSNYPTKSYYLFSTRIFEFMIGVIISYIPQEKKRRKITDNILSIFSFFILLFIAISDSVLPGYPNLYTIGVCICAAIIIYTGKNKTIIYKALSINVIVFIGTISYSLYLWHWPVFAAARYIGYFETNTEKLSAILITLILSYISYSYIENELKKSKLNFKYTLLILFVIPVIISLVLSKVTEKNTGFSFRLGSEYLKMEKALKDHQYENRSLCLSNDSVVADGVCHTGKKNADKKAFLFGDSHSNHFWGFMDVVGKDANMDVKAQATSSCLTLPGVYLYDWWNYKNTVYQRCYDDTKKYYNEVKAGNYDYVIIAEVWANYAGDNVINQIGDTRTVKESRSRTEKALREALDIITESGAKPVIFKAINPMPQNFMTCFYQNVKLRRDYRNNNCNSGTFNGDEQEWFSQLFVTLKKEYPSLVVIDPKDIQCDTGTCLTDIDGIPVYRDVGHLTDYASVIFGKWYLDKYQNPFK